MSRLIVVMVAVVSISASVVNADPPTTCPRVILTFYQSGTNLGRFWLCKAVNFNPEPPHNITCTINEENYYDVGQYDESTNDWWIYTPLAEHYDSYQIRPDPACSTSRKEKK